jgi:hypothetical protein
MHLVPVLGGIAGAIVARKKCAKCGTLGGRREYIIIFLIKNCYSVSVAMLLIMDLIKVEVALLLCGYSMYCFHQTMYAHLSKDNQLQKYRLLYGQIQLHYYEVEEME